MQKYIRINARIRVPEVRLIGSDGEQLGVMNTRDALSKAREDNLDLVEIAPQAKPPVCRIMDYSKFKYEQSKKEKEARKRQRIIHIKEIRCKPKIEEHDYQVKLGRLVKFLQRGDKVKVSLMFRGREQAHPELGRKVLERFSTDVLEYGVVESPPRKIGRFMNMVISPRA